MEFLAAAIEQCLQVPINASTGGPDAGVRFPFERNPWRWLATDIKMVILEVILYNDTQSFNFCKYRTQRCHFNLIFKVFYNIRTLVRVRNISVMGSFLSVTSSSLLFISWTTPIFRRPPRIHKQALASITPLQPTESECHSSTELTNNVLRDPCLIGVARCWVTGFPWLNSCRGLANMGFAF